MVSAKICFPGNRTYYNYYRPVIKIRDDGMRTSSELIFKNQDNICAGKTAYNWSIRQTEAWGLTNTKAYSKYQAMYNSYDVNSYPYVRPVRIQRPIR